MTRTVYQNIMTNAPDRQSVQHDWWVNGHQTVRWVISPNLTSPAEQWSGSHLTWGCAPSPQCSLCRSRGWCTCPQKWGAWTEWPPLLSTHHIILVLVLSFFSGGMLMMTDNGQLPLVPSLCRDHVISANPGGGHGYFLSDFICCGITSLGRVVCEVVFLVTVGCFLPHAVNKDPLDRPSGFSFGVTYGLVGQLPLTSAISPLSN